MLAENLGDSASVQEPEGVLLLPPLPAKDALPGDGGVASEPVAVGGDLEGSVGMEIEVGADADFMVEDGEELVGHAKCCVFFGMWRRQCFKWAVEVGVEPGDFRVGSVCMDASQIR